MSEPTGGAVGFTPDTTDEQLCELFAQTRDNQFYTEIDRRMRPVMFGKLLHEQCHGDGPAAEDALQSALMELFEAPQDFDARLKLLNYLMTIAIRKAIDQHRKRHTRRVVSLEVLAQPVRGDYATFDIEDDRAMPGDEDAAKNEQLERLSAAIEALPDMEKAVVQALDIEGLSHKAASDKLGIPIGSITTYERRAHKAIQVRMRVRNPV